MAITTFSPPSSEGILQQMLQNYSAIAASNGYIVSIAPGTEIYMRFSAIAQQQAIFYQIALQQFDSRLPDTATGSDLDRVLNQFGLVRKPASSSEGFIQLIGSGPQALTAGMLLSGPNGLKYQVSTSGVYQNSNSPSAITNPTLSYVPVVSVSQGSNTNLGAGESLTWINLPPLTQSTAPVVVALEGGSDAETDSQARFRLMQTLQNPPNSSNAQFLINLASTVDPIVESGFVYPNYNGSGSQLIALMGYQSNGFYIGRDIPHLPTDTGSPYNIFSNLFGENLSNDTSAIFGQLSAVSGNQYATTVTTVNNNPTNYVFSLSLPYPIGNQVNGYGGGWLNNYSQTFPVPSASTSVSITSPLTTTLVNCCPVTLVSGSTSITVRANGTYLPIAGLTKIQWIDRSGAAGNGWKVVTATVLSYTKALVTGTAYDFSLVLDTPLVCGVPTTTPNTLVASSSYGATLPQSTINVTSTSGFPSSGVVWITNTSGYPQQVSYTSISSTTFNGATGGTGILGSSSYVNGAQTDFYGNSQVAVNDLIFPASTNAQNYVNTVMNSYANLGPGQVVASNSYLINLGASRQPAQSATYSPILGNKFLQSLTANNSEIYSANKLYNSTDGINNTPANANPPNIFIPCSIAFYNADLPIV